MSLTKKQIRGLASDARASRDSMERAIALTNRWVQTRTEQDALEIKELVLEAHAHVQGLSLILTLAGDPEVRGGEAGN